MVPMDSMEWVEMTVEAARPIGGTADGVLKACPLEGMEMEGVVVGGEVQGRKEMNGGNGRRMETGWWKIRMDGQEWSGRIGAGRLRCRPVLKIDGREDSSSARIHGSGEESPCITKGIRGLQVTGIPVPRPCQVHGLYHGAIRFVGDSLLAPAVVLTLG